VRKKRKTASPTTPPGVRDYVAIADAFARDAIADVNQDTNCYWIRLAASRYLKDRKRAAAKGGPFRFSLIHANDACDFIEKLPHVEGRWDTETVVLHPSHVFFLVNLFGFRLHNGSRRFTSALLCIARKNAKSWLAAAIMLYCLCCEDEPGPQVISAATTGSQARIVFNAAKRMVEMTPDLREAFNLEPYANAIANWQVAGNFKPINAKASTQDGLNPSHVVLDEIHAHKTHDLLNVLQSAAGARHNVLWLYTTTEGYESPGPWPEMRKFAQQLLSGTLEADHFFALIFTLDEQRGAPGDADYRAADDDFDESKWIKANPLMTVNPILAREIAKAAIDAKQMPGRHAEFKIKRLNRPASSANTWLNIERWKRCNGAIDLDFLEGKDCWAAIDGASTTDLMSFRLVWRHEGVVYTWGRNWVPTDAVAQRTERGTVPYAAWVQAGLITQLPGNVLDYSVIENDIVGLCERFKPKIVAYDSWNLRDLVSRLTKRLPKRRMPDDKMKSILEEFRQGGKSYNPAMRECERLYLSGKLQHGGDPVLNFCAANVVPRFDENMNMSPDKKRAADRIDAAVALFMAIGVMGLPAPEPRKFQAIFV
jgi:phage terminase large subunit-like protein